MKIIETVKGNTKKDYKEAINNICDDLKNRVDDILCDFDKHIREININLKIEYGCVSVISITKEMCVEKEDNLESKGE